MSESRLSYADALRARVNDTRLDMIALGPTRPQTNEPNGTNVALVSTNILPHNSVLSDQDNPYKLWDGEKSTLAPFLAELEITLSAHDSALYTFAVEFYAMLSNGKTVLSYRGQAAQLDGALPRPTYMMRPAGRPAPRPQPPPPRRPPLLQSRTYSKLKALPYRYYLEWVLHLSLTGL